MNAISLAVIGAVAAPFAFHTYKARPMSRAFIPMTSSEKAAIVARLNETKNCQTLDDLVDQLRASGRLTTSTLLHNNDFLNLSSCHDEQRELENGGHFESYPDTLKYLGINAATAGFAFGIIFGLTYLLPAVVRRYWRWLNT